MYFFMRTGKKCIFLAMLLFSIFQPFEAIFAQNTLGGHFGFVQPLVTIQDGDANSGFDPHTIGFPIGITVRKNEKFAFDAEFVPLIAFNAVDKRDNVNLLIHPGVLWGLNESLTFGARLAFETGTSGRYGFTPLLNKSFTKNGIPLFAEFVLPVRVGSDQKLAVTAGIHIGVGF